MLSLINVVGGRWTMRVFISHLQQDNALAKKVAKTLEEVGLEVWDAQDILPGDNWFKEISESLEQSQAMVVLITPESLGSMWIRKEIEYALGNESFSGRLIPVVIGRLEDMPKENLPWILRHLNIIELPNPENEEEIQRIADALCSVS